MTIVINKNTSKKEFEKKLTTFQKAKSTKGVDLAKHVGVVHLKKDALQIQKELRNEWE